MSSNDFKAKLKIAQDSVKDVDKDLRKSAFEIILRKLLEGEEAAEPVEGAKKDSKKKKPKGVSPVSVAPIALNLKGGKGIPPLADFYKKKAPRRHQEKVTVYVYYINKHLGITDVLSGHVVSCYNEVGEKKPLNILQLFRDIKHHKGWLEVGETPHSVRVSISGENLVEHDLPRSKK